jgi:hypothetical protein
MIPKIFAFNALREKHEKKEDRAEREWRYGLFTFPTVDREQWPVEHCSTNHFHCAPGWGNSLQT